MAKPKTLGAIHLKILDLLKAAPSGLTIYEIRDQLVGLDVQQHLDKRVRELRYLHNIPWNKSDGRYTYKGVRTVDLSDDGSISARLRAKVLNLAHGKCQMCGRTITEDGIRLELDHKIPRNWGGLTDENNLWAICQLCNGGKRDFFSSFDDEFMKKIVGYDSVYERIGQTLRLYEGKPTPAWLLQFVANSNDYQEDWQKRLRELRYLGWKISSSRSRNEQGKWEASYTLLEWSPLPEDHKFLIKDYERNSKVRNSR